MSRIGYLPFILLCVGITAYVAVSRLTFAAPATVSQAADNNDCGFNPADFTAAGQLRFSNGQAWWVSFLRKQEYFSALSMGFIVGFMGFAVMQIRQIGATAAAGAVAGGSILGVLALCLGCLAPTLSAVGLGLLGSLTLPIPKWLMTLSTLALTAWGTVFLSRRAAACPLSLSVPRSTGVDHHARTTHIAIVVFLCVQATVAWAGQREQMLTPARPGMPLADPIATADIPPPPLSLMKDRPVNPMYLPGLPGLPQGKLVSNDYGVKKPKFDGIIIRQSRVQDGEVLIPAGGLVYLEDTWRGEVALVGERIAYLGQEPIYIDYDMSIVVKKDVTIPRGESVVVGGQVYHYYATVGHGRTANHTLHVRTIAGTDWEWAFGAPVLSTSQTNWWEGTRFAQLYNQGQAREVTPKQLVFDWISGVRMDRLLMAQKQVFAGWAAPGQAWDINGHRVRLVGIDEQAGTAQIDIRDGSRVVYEKKLGPVQADLLIEDSGARKALVFEYADVAGFMVPWPKALQDGKAQLKLYSGAFSIRYGADDTADPRFATYPVGCPTGHNFGIMWTNKEPIHIAPGGSATGPSSYFKIIVQQVQDDHVLAWYVEDRQGNRSINLGGPEVSNIDLVLGQGRITGQAILKDVGRAMLQRLYTTVQQQ